jgi:hypothetical protein
MPKKNGKSERKTTSKTLVTKPHHSLGASVNLQMLLPKLKPLVATLKQRTAMLAAAKAVYLTDTKTDFKSLQDSVDLANAEIAVLRGVFRSSNKLDVQHIVLVDAFTNTSPPATAQAPVMSVIPGGSATEFASLATLFDEMICDSVEVLWDLNCVNTNTVEVHGAIAYDPINVGAYGSVAGVLEASQFDGPTHISLCTRTMSPVPMTRTGMFHKVFHMPKGPEVKDPGVPNVIGTGQWTSTSVTSTVYGYVKGYVEPASAGLSTVLIAFMRMHCRFRSRT